MPRSRDEASGLTKQYQSQSRSSREAQTKSTFYHALLSIGRPIRRLVMRNLGDKGFGYHLVAEKQR